MNPFRDIQKHRDLILILVQRTIKIRYKSSLLGFFWTFLSPILLIAIYWSFLRILRFAIDLPVLVVGIIVWQYLSMCLGDSLQAVVGNTSMVKKSAFPRFILPLSMALANLLNLLLSLGVVLVYLALCGIRFGPIYWLPLIILVQFALCLGLSFLVSCLNVFFRDMEHILGILLMAWFFLTPVIYPATMVTDRFDGILEALYFANPMAGIVSLYRSALLGDPLPQSGLVLLSFGVAAVIPVLGFAVFQRYQTRFADVL